MPYIKKISTKTKLLIYEYKKQFPETSSKFISNLLNLDLLTIEKLFNEGEITIPSKMNK